jgi:hypothetical protein
VGILSWRKNVRLDGTDFLIGEKTVPKKDSFKICWHTLTISDISPERNHLCLKISFDAAAPHW